MWALLSEQMSAAREYRLGKPFDLTNIGELDFSAAIGELFNLAFGIPLSEMRFQAKLGAMRLAAGEATKPIFANLVDLLLSGEENLPAEAIQLLLLDKSDSLASSLADRVSTLINHADIGVAEPAGALLERWGHKVEMTAHELSPLYRFSYAAPIDVQSAEVLKHSNSGAVALDDPLGWTSSDWLSDIVERLAGDEVTVEAIHRRCEMFIREWGGIERFGQAGTWTILESWSQDSCGGVIQVQVIVNVNRNGVKASS